MQKISEIRQCISELGYSSKVVPQTCAVSADSNAERY